MTFFFFYVFRLASSFFFPGPRGCSGRIVFRRRRFVGFADSRKKAAPLGTAARYRVWHI